MRSEAPAAAPGLLPLSLHPAALRGFVEVHLEPGGPHRAVEVQRLDLDGRPVTIVITHRPTGEMDVLTPPGSGLDRAWVADDPFLAHLPLGSIGEADFRAQRCSVGDRRVDVEVDVDHPAGHRLEVRVVDTFSGRARPRFAPTVPGQSDPTTLRFMLGSGVRRLTTGAERLLVSVDGHPQQPRRSPVPWWPAPWLAARSGAGIFGVGLNLSGQRIVSRPPTIAHRDTGPELVVRRDGTYLRFRLMADGADSDTGRLVVDSSVGRVAKGDWRLERHDDGIGLVLSDVVQRWFPGWGSGSQLAVFLARLVKRRRESWTWSGRSTVDDGQIVHTGRWYVARTHQG